MEPKNLIEQLEKQLGRELTANEKRLILLAEEISDKRTNLAEAKTAGAE